MDELMISEIYCYPIKSLGGFRLSRSRVLGKGLEWDRRWMLVDATGNFLTQRNHAGLALFRVTNNHFPESFEVSYLNHSIQIPVTASGSQLEAVIWNDTVKVQEVSPHCNDFFSRILQMDCRLVFFPETALRPVDPHFAINSSNQTSLSDGYPLLMLGQSSLADLNRRLPQPVGLERFRPNIVFTGAGPYAEDDFREFSIGGVHLTAVKPCARCIMTTIDQQTALKGNEPLATLSTYRKRNNKVLFGMNVIPKTEGYIEEGDKIVLY